MISITLDLDAGTAKLANATTIKSGGFEPVKITLSRDPAGPIAFELAFGPQSATQGVLAFLDTFTQTADLEYSGMLDLTDLRLAQFLSSVQSATINGELAWTVNNVPQVAPNFTVTAQPRIVQEPTSSQGGPVYVTTGGLAVAIAAVTANGTNASIIVGDYTLTITGGLITAITTNA